VAATLREGPRAAGRDGSAPAWCPQARPGLLEKQSQLCTDAPSCPLQDRDEDGDTDAAPQPPVVPTQVFRWTGRNNFFVKGDVDLLMVGGGR